MVSAPATVLVVDDDEQVADYYSTILSDDYEIRTSHTGGEALEKLDDTVDVVLLDRRMPTLNGAETLRKIRERGCDVRVGIVTAVDPDVDIVDMEFDAYLTKPLVGTELTELVERLLALSHHDDRTKEQFSVATKKAALEHANSRRELDESAEYAALVERYDELDAVTTASVEEGDGDFLAGVVSSLGNSRDGRRTNESA